MPKCLVLGANGFLGSHLVDSLVSRGLHVRTFERISSKPAYEHHPNIEQFKGDFLNKADLDEALDGIDYVYHFISTTTPVTAENDPSFDIDTNVRGSVALFEACVKKSVKRVFFASTGGAIYGENNVQPYTETSLTQPVSPYAIGKLSIEGYLRYFRRKHGLHSTVFRISNPYGERQSLGSKQGVIPIFLENIYRGRPITVYGDGSMIRDYVYVKDLTRAIASVAQSDFEYEVYNVGSATEVSVNELIAIAKRVTGKEVNVEHIPAPSTFVQSVVLDDSRFVDEFSPFTTTELEDGMKQTYEHIKQKVDNE